MARYSLSPLVGGYMGEQAEAGSEKELEEAAFVCCGTQEEEQGWCFSMGRHA